jgi:hypothetical protein
MARLAGDPYRPRRRRATLAAVLFAAVPCALQTVSLAQDAPPDDSSSIPALTDDRILGVIPNYMTVSDPDAKYVPLTTKQKWSMALKSSIDPYTGFSALLGAATSQKGDNTPKYGEGDKAFAARFGAAMADFSSQNFFSGAVLATVLHQDPRYFRRGPKSRLLVRVGYSLSLQFIAKDDSGKWDFNYCNVLGMGMGIAFSNVYYPHSSENGEVMWSRVGTSLMGGAISNLMSEFWPDLRTKVMPKIIPWKKW